MSYSRNCLLQTDKLRVGNRQLFTESHTGINFARAICPSQQYGAGRCICC